MRPRESKIVIPLDRVIRRNSLTIELLNTIGLDVNSVIREGLVTWIDRETSHYPDDYKCVPLSYLMVDRIQRLMADVIANNEAWTGGDFLLDGMIDLCRDLDQAIMGWVDYVGISTSELSTLEIVHMTQGSAIVRYLH